METSRIKSVSIKKLWGVKNISTEFNEYVNIFIGTNGSSKTTFLNLIEATLISQDYIDTIDYQLVSNAINNTKVKVAIEELNLTEVEINKLFNQIDELDGIVEGKLSEKDIKLFEEAEKKHNKKKIIT